MDEKQPVGPHADQVKNNVQMMIDKDRPGARPKEPLIQPAVVGADFNHRSGRRTTVSSEYARNADSQKIRTGDIEMKSAATIILVSAMALSTAAFAQSVGEKTGVTLLP